MSTSGVVLNHTYELQKLMHTLLTIENIELIVNFENSYRQWSCSLLLVTLQNKQIAASFAKISI